MRTILAAILALMIFVPASAVANEGLCVLAPIANVIAKAPAAHVKVGKLNDAHAAAVIADWKSRFANRDDGEAQMLKALENTAASVYTLRGRDNVGFVTIVIVAKDGCILDALINAREQQLKAIEEKGEV